MLLEESRWNAHNFEPWTCGFDYWNLSTILTGGDDCKLKVWDSRDGLKNPVLVNKQFEGGVTAIRSHHLREHTFAVGSYDEVLRIFDKRNFSKALWNHNCGGGIWRLKWHTDWSEKLLVAAMHDGFKILDIDSAGLNTPPQINTIYNGHSSLAYGADWGETVLMNGKSSTIVGSCSFYDRSIQAWGVDLND
ncbi:WD40-repeat-containing domain protein [Phakopsora pachyrhizi]|nr:WD40-repeat-containing domain protein [Phakopsora pachyrhizi]